MQKTLNTFNAQLFATLSSLNMNEYDFTKLNDKEFEALAIDLIGKMEGRRIERFKPGKDAGVDGRFFVTSDEEVIIQCKHWPRTGLTALIRNLKATEAAKVDKLKPARYLLVTSLELSRQNKKTITNIFAPHIKSESDILGKEDLNSLLSEYSEIEERHYKLWLSSTNVLKLIINAAVIGRSSFKIDEINDFASKYVRTSGHDRALQKLESMRSIIITGEPGIGKTTLADHLCLNYIIEGYQLCYIEESISEAEELFDKEKKQIFYFDDFLGRNYLMALGRHEDSHVINFIKRVAKAKGKRFILTSRSTVLNQGKRLSDLFKVENIDRNEYELNIKELTGLEKAKILYNHIWFSELDPQYVDELYFNKRYKKIIKHGNYNPRLISFITDAHKVADINPSDYWSYVENTLEDPADIWGHVFDNQLDDHSRKLVCLVTFNGKGISEDELKLSFRDLSKRDGNNAGNSEFYSSIKLAVGAVLNRKITGRSDIVTYDLFNPAIGDYLLSRYREDEDMLYDLFQALNTNDSLENMESLLDNEVVNRVVIEKVLSRLLSYCLIHSKDPFSDYIVQLIYLSIKKVNLDQEARERLRLWVVKLNLKETNLSKVGAFFESIKWMLENQIFSDSEIAMDDLFESILTNDLEHDDYVGIGLLLGMIDEEYREKYTPKFKRLVIEYWEDMIDQDIASSGKLDEFFYDEEVDEAENVLHDYVTDLLAEHVIEFEDSDVEAICEFCDVWNHIESNRENAAIPDEHREFGAVKDYSGVSEDVAIDNLFERT